MLNILEASNCSNSEHDYCLENLKEKCENAEAKTQNSFSLFNGSQK